VVATGTAVIAVGYVGYKTGTMIANTEIGGDTVANNAGDYYYNLFSGFFDWSVR
jgi:hypothetical protein